MAHLHATVMLGLAGSRHKYSAISRTGRVPAGYDCAVGADHSFAIRIRFTSSYGVRATSVNPVIVDTAHGRGHVPAQLGITRARLVFGLAATTSGSSCSCPASKVLEITQPGPAAATGASADGSQPVRSYQIGMRLLCAGERQGPLEVQRLAADRQTRGNQWPRTEFGLKHHQVRPACHRGPARLRPLTGRSGKHEGEPGPGARIAVIPANRGRPVPDVRGRT